MPEQYRSAGIVVAVSLSLIALGSLAFIRRAGRISRERDSFNQPHVNSRLTVYRLYCHRCGYKWEVAADEWEMKGRQERDQLVNFPRVMPPGKPASVESFEKIEWKPPDPKRGILIIVGAIAISLIASLSVMGLFWSPTHPDNPYSLLVMGIISALLIYLGLLMAFRFRGARRRVVPLVILLLVVLVGFAVRLLLK
ncbi:MAG: hypothetical protein AB1649_11340 [Chloroflexota bacterium]